MIAHANRFRKQEKLCSKKVIEQLIQNKNSSRIIQYPYILIWQEHPDTIAYPAQILISVGKKYSRKAVKRNRVKRQIREIYRVQKEQLYGVLRDREKKLALVLFYIGKEEIPFTKLEQSFERLIIKLSKVV